MRRAAAMRTTIRSVPIAHLQAMDAGAGPQESPVQAVAGSAKQPVLLSREHAEIPAARQFSADVVVQHGA